MGLFFIIQVIYFAVDKASPLNNVCQELFSSIFASLKPFVTFIILPREFFNPLSLSHPLTKRFTDV